MSRARIKVNGVVGSNTDLPIGTLVQLNNDGDGLEQTYLWTLLSQPAGTSDGLSSGTIVNPTITTNKEGSYRLLLVVDQGLISEHSNSVILGIRQLKTRTRIPAVGETTEATDWGQAVAPILQMVDALRADPGLLVVQLGAGSFVVSTLTRVSSVVTIKNTLPGQEDIFVVIPTTAVNNAGAKTPIYAVVGAVDGGSLTTGKLAYVRRVGLIEGVSLIGGSPGDPVYLADTGAFALAPGTVTRQLARILTISGGIATIHFDGTGWG